MSRNRYGLSRDIPHKIAREIRQACRFGCINCRAGIYEYEHIEPSFADARRHEAKNICCLCGMCHQLVTSGMLAKQTIRAAYDHALTNGPSSLPPPHGPVDFSGPDATVEFGDLLYAPAVRRVLSYHGETLLSVLPGYNVGDPGNIRALLTDNSGNVTLAIRDNRWVGDTQVWDIEIAGKTLTVRTAAGRIALRIITKPPSRIVIDRLDMRYGDAHFLVANGKYAVGRYVTDQEVFWCHCQIKILKSTLLGTGVEFTDPQRLEVRDQTLRPTSQYMVDPTGTTVLHVAAGALFKPFGIAIGGLTGVFQFGSWAMGSRDLEGMRQVIVQHPDSLDKFIGTGSC